MSVGFIPAKADAAKKKPTLNKTKVTLDLRGKVTLKVNKNKNKIKSTKWTSNDKNIATVSKKGVVTSKTTLGTAKITATVKYKSGKKTKTAKLSCKVTVKDWALATDPTVSDVLKAAIKKYYDEEIDGVQNITPMAVLAESTKQNAKRVFCKVEKNGEEPTSEESTSYYAINEYWLNKDGSVLMNDVYASLDLGTESYTYPTDLPGGTVEVSDPTIDPLYKGTIDKFISDNKIPYTPVAILAKKASTMIPEEVIAICKREVTGGNESTTKAGYFIVQVKIDSTLNPEIGYVIPITLKDEDYSVALTDTSSITPNDVEYIATQIKRAFIANDSGTIADYIDYGDDLEGIQIGDALVHNRDEFLALNLAWPEAFIASLNDEPCLHMFANGSGIMLGNGEVWLNEASDGSLKISSIDFPE
ncbi:MAG: Ig-like domain-containing protein [Eubacterium sp.]|nr:Ig-like domain-containing protein [Eubacterium sp.]